MTIDKESRLNLETDEPEVAALLVEHGGLLDRDDRLGDETGDAAVYWATMRPHWAPGETYIARIEWFAYPYEPPSIKFATGVRGSLSVTSAWPVITGYRAASFDICKPMCREGYVTHLEWKEGSTAWPTQGNPFLWVVFTMQIDFNDNYQGRAA